MTAVPPTSIDARSATYEANRTHMQGLLDKVLDAQARVLEGGGDATVARHRERGRMLARERIDLLLDRDSPFLELSALAGWGTDDPVGGGLVVGLGLVEGTECLISANDPTVRGGTSSPASITKTLRSHEIAERNRLPVINLTESGGADLPKQAQIFVPGGATFKNLTRLSAAGIPTVTVVFGSSTAGGAYVPGMSDHTIFVKDQAKVFLGGPPLVKMAIDEDADEEELGGAEMHARTSGLADHLAVDEIDAIRLARLVVRNLNWHKLGPGPSWPALPPLLDPDELLGVVPADPREPFDVREVIWRVVDGSRFDEFKPLYGTQLVTGWASIGGFPVGILANNGILFSEESQKGAQFIQLCNQRDIPLVFVQNITGFMVGTSYEQEGIIKHGSQLINAVSNSTVPHLTLMVGASYGAGNYAMSGRAYDPRFVFSWPNHHIAVMGPKQLAGVLSIVQRASAERRGEEFDEAADREMRTVVESQIERESTALAATGQQWDDGIVDPRETRVVLAIALSCIHTAPVRGADSFGVFRL
jgi:acetyl-CoA carboxylase carboxyltransferase component